MCVCVFYVSGIVQNALHKLLHQSYLGLVFSYPWERRLRNKVPWSRPHATPEVELGFNMVIIAPEPSLIPLSQAVSPIASQRRKKKQNRFLLEGQDLLERAPPQNNILEVLYEVGVTAVALPGAWYPGWGNTSQGSRSMEDVTKIGKHWTLGYGMWVCATIPSSIRKQEAQTGPSLALKPGVSKSGKRSRCLGLSGYRLTAFLTNAQTPASPTKWRLALGRIHIPEVHL